VVSTPLKHISQLGWFFPIYEKKKTFQTTNQIINHRLSMIYPNFASLLFGLSGFPSTLFQVLIDPDGHLCAVAEDTGAVHLCLGGRR